MNIKCVFSLSTLYSWCLFNLQLLFYHSCCATISIPPLYSVVCQKRVFISCLFIDDYIFWVNWMHEAIQISNPCIYIIVSDRTNFIIIIICYYSPGWMDITYNNNRARYVCNGYLLIPPCFQEQGNAT